MNRPDLFLQGNTSFTDAIVNVAEQAKRIADSLQQQVPLAKKAKTAPVNNEEDSESSKSKVAKSKVIYIVSDWDGSVTAPSYARFFYHFAQTREGRGFYTAGASVKLKCALALTWLLNQPSAVLLSASHSGQSTLWTVAIDE